MQLDAVVMFGAGLMIWNKRPQQAAGDVRCAGNHPVRLVHRQHHRAEIIRLQHGLARFRGLHALFPAQPEKAVGKIFQFLALRRVDDADAFERNVQTVRDGLHFGRVAEHDGGAQPQGIELPGRLQDARFLAFGKNHPLGMPLQFFNDVADETHGDRLAVKPKTAK